MVVVFNSGEYDDLCDISNWKQSRLPVYKHIIKFTYLRFISFVFEIINTKQHSLKILWISWFYLSWLYTSEWCHSNNYVNSTICNNKRKKMFICVFALRVARWQNVLEVHQEVIVFEIQFIFISCLNDFLQLIRNFLSF